MLKHVDLSSCCSLSLNWLPSRLKYIFTLDMLYGLPKSTWNHALSYPGAVWAQYISVVRKTPSLAKVATFLRYVELWVSTVKFFRARFSVNIYQINVVSIIPPLTKVAVLVSYEEIWVSTVNSLRARFSVNKYIGDLRHIRWSTIYKNNIM